MSSAAAISFRLSAWRREVAVVTAKARRMSLNDMRMFVGLFVGGMVYLKASQSMRAPRSANSAAMMTFVENTWFFAQSPSALAPTP